MLIDSKTIRAKFQLLGPLSKGYNIVAYICRSSRRIATFKEYAGRIIPIDNYTRWNSQYKMLKVLLDLRSAVEQYCTKYKDELEDNILSF